MFLVFSSPKRLMLAILIPVSALGLRIRDWAAGHARKCWEITRSGPYQYTRNPLYPGALLMGSGVMTASGRRWLVAVFAAVYIGISFPVMRIEAGELKKKFKDDYPAYAERVPLLIPYDPSFRGDEKKFELGLYLRYREYRAALGLAAVYAVLAAKMLLAGFLI